MEDNCVSIRECAKKAKQRLSSGFWNTVELNRIKYIKEHYHSGDNISQLNYMFQKIVEDEVYGTKKVDKEEEKFYKKVKKLLTENEYVLNPIIKLIDHEVYDGLSDIAKQNYIYELTDKYNKMKEKIEQEQKNDMFLNC